MTNEELAIRAQNGDKTAEEALYLRVQPLLRKLAGRYLRMCGQARVGQEDLLQETYFAFRSAVRAYALEKGYRFTTYLEYPVQTVCRAAIGIQNGGIRETPLSLEEPVGEEGTLGDLLADEGLSPEEQSAQAELREIIRWAVAQLPEPQRTLVEGQYFEHSSMELLGRQLGLEPARAQRLKQDGMRRLRRMRAVRALSGREIPRVSSAMRAEA